MKRLLIVDDNEQNLYLLQVLLSANGFQVEQALNGAEALEHARRAPPDMIISDLLMPVMDGYTLLNYWKNDELLKTIPFIVYTATYTDAKDEHLARSLGADDFILKPTESKAFVARIQNVLVKAKQGELSPVREPASDKKALMNEYSEVLIRKLEEKALQLQHANRTLEEDIAERKKTENALRLDGEIMANMAEGVQLTRENDAVIVYTNSQFEKMFGYGPGELLGKHVSVLNASSEISSKGMADEIIRTLKNKGAWDGEILNIRKNGATFWCHASISTFVHPDHGKVWISVQQDISERKRAETALGVSEVRYRRLFESAKDGILILNAETGMVLDVNPFLIKMLEYSHEQFIGKAIWELGFLRDIVASRENFLELQEKGYIRYEDLPLETASGRRLDVEFVSNVYLVDNMKVIQCNIRDITEWLSQRKLAEESLRQSEARYRILFEQAADIILQLEITPEGMPVIRDANNATLRLLGYERDELIGKPVSFLEATPDASKVVDKRRQNVLSGPGKVFEARHRCKDGTIRDFECSATEMQIGSKTFAVSFERDITERKRAEDAQLQNARDMEFLSRSAMTLVELTSEKDVYQHIGELLKEIIPENTVAAVSEFDESARVFHGRNIIGIDKTIGMIKKILGKDPMELSGDFGPAAKKALLSGKLGKIDEGLRDFAQILPESIARAVEKLLGIKAFFVIGFVKEGKVLGGLSIFLRKESVLANSGAIEAFAAQAAIAIAKRKAEQSLRESEEKYRSLVDGASETILVIQDGILKFVNHNAVELAGYPESELMGKSFPEFIYPDDRKMVVDKYARRIKGDLVGSRYEFRLLPHDGDVKWVEINAVLIDWNGKPATLNFLTDISERKRLEKEKEHLLAQLLQAQKMEAIGTLAGGVAHDFNNLLTAISGFTTMAMGKIGESDPIQKDLRQVSTAATRAASLTRQLLLFSRKQHMEPMPLAPNATISRLLKMLDRLIGEDIVIEADLGNDIWSILGDEGNIEQVLMNLSVNARDAMPQGGKLFIKTENVTIDEEYCRTYNSGRPGRFVCLSISDTGTGMDELTLEHIFEPFFTTKAEGKGTGLGLSVVFGIVQQHKGWINVYSELGHGTTFKIYFPSTSDTSEQQSQVEAPLVSLEGKGERIMVVEDQPEVRAIANQMLLTNGYSVFPVSSAKEAMELFEKENGRFDLVFSDVVLPDRSGVLLVQELLQRWKFKVIITSGYTDEKANWDFIKENNFRFLHKPYAIRPLLQAVREVLAEKKS